MSSAAPDRDQHDAAAGELRAEAIGILTHRILTGKHRVGIYELLDAWLDSERRKILLEALTTLLLNESGEREAIADQMNAKLITEYLNRHDHLIEETAAMILASAD